MPTPAEDRAAKLAALRKQQQGGRWKPWAAAGVALVLILAAVGIFLGTRGGDPSPAGESPASGGPASGSSANAGGPGYGPQTLPSAVTGSMTKQPAPSRVENTSGISGVLAWDTAGYPGSGTPGAGTLGHDHVTGPVTYAVTPPVGGPHSAVWMNAGVYSKPVPSERAVHNMEHGAVWITYRPSLPTTQVNALVALVGKQSLIAEPALAQQDPSLAGQQNRFIDLTPWASDALPTPIVVSAWGHQLQVKSATDPRMQRFIDTFRNSSTYTPEYGSPVDGIPTGTGGVAALYGGTEKNPGGSAN